MTGDLSSQFVEYLRQRKHLAVVDGHDDGTGQGGLDRRQSKLWELAELSPGEFAEEAAGFFGLERITLQDMMSAVPLVSSFSQRFLRESAVFPCRATDGPVMLAVADPTDQAAQRAAQIVLGAHIVIRIAASEDIAVVLDHRLNGGDAEVVGALPAQPREDDIESLRDLASGAPVVRAVNDLIEKAVELRASDIHIEPFDTGLVVRMRIDGLLRQVTTPAGVLPQAVISRIKIVANLNIAERRLPQDGAARLRAGRADRYPRCDHADTARGIRRNPHSAEGSRAACGRPAGIFATRRNKVAAAAEAAAWHDRHHRSDRQRQDHDACDDIVDPE